jgi:hypothetical protein
MHCWMGVVKDQAHATASHTIATVYRLPGACAGVSSYRYIHTIRPVYIHGFVIVCADQHDRLGRSTLFGGTA